MPAASEQGEVHGGGAIGRQPCRGSSARSWPARCSPISAAAARFCGARCWSRGAFVLAVNLFRGFGAPLVEAEPPLEPAPDEPARPASRHRPGRAEGPPQATRCARCGRLPLSMAARFARTAAARRARASGLLVAGKLVNITVPFLYKHAVDALAPGTAVIAVPVVLVVAYGSARVMAQGFDELRNAVFAKVEQRAVRRSALSAFRHLHALSLRFHLERRTGGLARAVERGTAASSFCCRSCCSTSSRPWSRSCSSAAILWRLYNWTFAAVTLATIALYIAFTFLVTDWRVRFRREMNERDSEANTKAVDSLLNFETVKYFANEEHEARALRPARCAPTSAPRSRARRRSALLNIGQGAIIACGLIGVMILAGAGRRRRAHDGRRFRAGQRLSDPALHAAQFPRHGLSQHQAVADRSRADVRAAGGRRPRSKDRPGAPASAGRARARSPSATSISATISGARSCGDVDFRVAARSRPSRSSGRAGAGKSTIARLLFRFYDVDAGAIEIDGQDIRDVTQDSLRRAIGVVPQDTVLFNDTILYNIAYGRPGAARAEIEEAARLARIHDFIAGLPDGYDTRSASAASSSRAARSSASRSPGSILKAPQHPDVRRGDLGARHQDRARNPGEPGRGRRRPHDAGHRPPAVDHRRRRRDPGARWRA